MDDCIMIKLIHMIDVNGTLKVTQGQRQNVTIKHAICVKLRRNLYLRGVNVLVCCRILSFNTRNNRLFKYIFLVASERLKEW